MTSELRNLTKKLRKLSSKIGKCTTEFVILRRIRVRKLTGLSYSIYEIIFYSDVLKYDVSLFDIKLFYSWQPRTVALNSGKKETASVLVSGPSTVEEATRFLAEGYAAMLLVASSERLRRAPGLAVLAEQRFEQDWLSLVGRAATPRGPVVQLDPMAPPPTVLQGEAVLVWRGVSASDVRALVERVDSRPYASRVR